MNDKEKLISLLILTDPNPYICESESGSCELTTCTECRARSTADLLIENDFLPVVRCKNCRKRHTWECAMHYESDDGEEQYGWEDDNDFCSWGERKDGDGNG